MADFVAVLKKTIDGLADNSPDMRQRVYAKARQTVAAKLAAITPPPPQIAVDRQHKALEDAIAAVEASYADGGAKGDDFDSILAELESGPAPQAAAEVPAVPSRAAADAPAPSSPPPAPSTPPVQQAREVAPPPATRMPEASGLRPSRLETPPELDDPADEPALAAVEPVQRQTPALPRATFDEPDTAKPASERAAARRRVPMALVAALIALVVVGGAGYGVWLNREAFSDLFGLGGNVVAEQPAANAPDRTAEPEAVAAGEPDEEEIEVAAAEPQAPASPAAAARTDPAIQKFTQRLNADGTETDPGPAGGEARIGEGTTLAAATETGAPAIATDAQAGSETAAPAALPVGQKAIFYEERTSFADGSADDGATVWSLVQESPGADLPPEPAVRAEVTVPSRDLSIRMTIRRNADASLPASHIVEMIFITAGTFEGGGVDNVLRIAFKNSEAAPGSPLIGIPAKIADGYFLVALSNNDAERNQNTQLMARESWIDIPIVYRSGRRALVTMEKGIPGMKVFEDAIRAWQSASSG